MPGRLADRIRQRSESVRTRMLDIAAGLEDVIALGRGDPDLPTPAHIVAAGQRALADGATHYTHPMGLPALREGIAGHLAEADGLDYEVDEVVVTTGAQEAVFAAMLACINPGDEVIVPSPATPPTTRPSSSRTGCRCPYRPTRRTTSPSPRPPWSNASAPAPGCCASSTRRTRPDR